MGRRNMLKIFVLLASFLAVTQAHDWYSGECPVLTPLSEFSMERMKDGLWYAVEKFDTTSKCLTYEFKDDPNGEKLVAPYVSEPANMIARFPLSLLGTASFVILDTDYNNYAFLCTCQSKSVLGFLTFHRRS